MENTNYWIAHIVNDMDETLIQRCVSCGKEITNYNGSVYIGQKPQGWKAGTIFQKGGITMTEMPENFIYCHHLLK